MILGQIMEIRLNPVPAGELLDPLRVGVQFGQDRLHRGDFRLDGGIDDALDVRPQFLEDPLDGIELWRIGWLLDEREVLPADRGIPRAQRAPRARSHTSAARSVSVLVASTSVAATLPCMVRLQKCQSLPPMGSTTRWR